VAEKPKLPEGWPHRGAPAERLLAWVNLGLEREHNPIIAVRRYGVGLTSLIEFTFRTGPSLSVEQSKVTATGGLRNLMLAYDGTVIPGYDQPALNQITSRLIWAANTSAHEDEQDTLVADLSRFLDRCLEIGVLVGRFDKDDGYGLLRAFVDVNRRLSRAPAVVAFDQENDELWVPRGLLWGWLREVRSKADSMKLRPVIEQLGWRWVDLQRRNPGLGEDKPHARAWAVPVAWDACEFDLEEALKAASPRPRPSPTPTREADAARARVPNGGTRGDAETAEQGRAR
jgi:hypothetical protein